VVLALVRAVIELVPARVGDKAHDYRKAVVLITNTFSIPVKKDILDKI
jgi:hypothetical protein